MAVDEIKGDSRSCLIVDEGRHKSESSFVLIENGIYQGFGYVEKEEDADMQEYREFLILQKDNRDIQRILRSFMNKNQDKITYVLPDENYQKEGGDGTLFSGENFWNG